MIVTASARDVKFMVNDYRGGVAIVDDDPAVLDSLQFLLELAGFPADTYTSALAFLAERTKPPACLILDQHMPQMTGLELAAHLRSEGIMVPILLITGAPAPAISSRASQLGIERVLEKPPTEEDLLTFVQQHHGMHH